MDKQLSDLYTAMVQADTDFQSAVIKQFGSKRAGDMRYQGSSHNQVTRLASESYWRASKAFLDAKDAASKSPESDIEQARRTR